MKHLFHLSAVALLIGATACDDLTGTDTDTDSNEGWCDLTDTFPASGPLSAGTYVDSTNDLDCQTYDGDVVVSYFPKPDCAGDKWTYTFETKGQIGAAQMVVFDDAGNTQDDTYWWTEIHDLDLGASHDNGWWDQLGKELPVVGFNDYEANTNSYITCEKNNGSSLTWAYQIFDADDVTTRVDCIILGKNSAGIVAEVPSLAGCEVLEGEAWTPK